MEQVCHCNTKSDGTVTRLRKGKKKSNHKNKLIKIQFLKKQQYYELASSAAP